jgi:GNAT superfamily N-acetyltransferase
VPSPSPPDVDAPIQSYLRASVTAGSRDVERIGPFLATFDRASDNPYLSYAIPDDGAAPSAEEVAALRQAFVRRGRVPRLEYLPAIAPAVEAALLAGGFAIEGRLPLMICTAGSEVELAAPPGVDIALATADEDLAAGGAVAHIAFGGEGEPGPDDVARTRRLLAGGGVAVLARDTTSGEAVGWGLCAVPRDATTEVVGIAVRESHRRRGIAGAITSRVVREAFARGVETAFLTPGDSGAERVYARAGFEPRTEMLHVRAA